MLLPSSRGRLIDSKEPATGMSHLLQLNLSLLFLTQMGPPRPEVPELQGPDFTPLATSHQVAHQAISLPSPSVSGVQSAILPPRVVQLASPAATLTIPSSGRTVPASAIMRKGKAPPFDTFSGEDPEVRLEDWFPSLQRASTWNGWTGEEELMQLAGSLRGCALLEWTLLSHSDRANVRSGVEALRNRLESGVKAMVAQDFWHCAQKKKEGVSDFICRLEKTFCLVYGHEAISLETRNTLLYGQLREGLALCYMESPSVSGATDYNCLCVAAHNEERWQAELQKRRSYQTPPSNHQIPDHLTPMLTSLPQASGLFSANGRHGATKDQPRLTKV